ncbi:hsp70-like protein C [Paramyrothecium foliicola]|nr:hsp70-like protein C [Paramyrothecium foliicola]
MAHSQNCRQSIAKLCLLAVLLLLFPLPLLALDETQAEYGPVVGIVNMASTHILSGARCTDFSIKDLGNTNARVAYQNRYGVIKLFKENGQTDIPAHVKFTCEGPRIGLDSSAAELPGIVVPFIKEYIGLNWTELQSQRLIPTDLFRTEKIGHRMAIRVPDAGEHGVVYMEDIAEMLLSYLKKIAETHLGRKVTHAIVGAPRDYSDAQRKAIAEAGEQAGLKILRVIPEDAAAIYAYELEQTGSKSILVADWGGDSLQVTLLEIRYSAAELLSSRVLPFGGKAFTQRILD